MKVTFNEKEVNPFSGLRKCLNLFQNNTNVKFADLDAAYEEVKDNKQNIEMFYVILFSIGDITNRQHNIFKKKVDKGGNSQRESFFTIMEWMKSRHFKQFVTFMKAGLFDQYTCFDNLFKCRVQTRNKQIIKVTNVFENEKYTEELLTYVCSIIKGNNPYLKHLVAKFLTIPRIHRRSGKKTRLPEASKIARDKALFLYKLSNKLGFEKICYFDEKSGEITYAIFKGYIEWRKDYNKELESVLFSSGEIFNYDKTEFIEWLDKLPSGARYRVKNKVNFSKNKDKSLKYSTLKTWFNEWEKYKENKQKEQRVLEEKIRQNIATDDDKLKLKEVRKEAKVNIGATNFNELYNDICLNKVDSLKLEAFIQKVNLPYNTLVFLDDSGSMGGAPYNFATFMAAVCLYKNPDDFGRNLLGFFNSTSRLCGFIDKKTSYINSLFNKQIISISPQPLINPELSFFDNFKRIQSFCAAEFRGGSTNIAGIPKYLQMVYQNNSQIIDHLKNYPIWTIISDGEWNNMYSPESSMNQFFNDCERLLGFRPYIIAIDINSYSGRGYNSDRFVNIENMIYIPSNPAQIEQILTNFKDYQVFDIYTPLQSLYDSNRYELVKQYVL